MSGSQDAQKIAWLVGFGVTSLRAGPGPGHTILARGGITGIDGGTDSESSPAIPAVAPQAQSPSPSPALTKARLVWVATRQRVDSQLGELHAAFSSAFKAHARQADLTKAFRTRVDSVLDTIDESLAHKLDALNGAADPAERAKLVQEAHSLIDGYSKHVASDETIAALDKNPFVPLAIQKTITATLAALTKTIR
jgi:hypothetical protein